MTKTETKNEVVAAEQVTLGPAMQALSAKRQRFVLALVREVPPGEGAEVAAAQIAGYVGSPAQVRSTASRLVHDATIIDAVIELARQEIMMDAPMALRTIREVARNKFSKDQLKAAQLILDRFMPATQQIAVKSETVDHTALALAHLKRLRSNPAITQDFLLSEFGELGLAHYSALLEAQEKQKPIEAEFVELPAPSSVQPVEPLQPLTDSNLETRVISEEF